MLFLYAAITQQSAFENRVAVGSSRALAGREDRPRTAGANDLELGLVFRPVFRDGLRGQVRMFGANALNLGLLRRGRFDAGGRVGDGFRNRGLGRLRDDRRKVDVAAVGGDVGELLRVVAVAFRLVAGLERLLEGGVGLHGSELEAFRLEPLLKSHIVVL